MRELIKKYQDIIDDLEYAKDQLNGPNASKETINLYNNSLRVYKEIIKDITKVSTEHTYQKDQIMNYLSHIRNLLG